MIDDLSSVLSSGHFWVGLGVGALLVAIACLPGLRGRARSMAVSLPFGLGSVTYELTSEDRGIAWRMYVQLVTRKAALPLDEEHDVVADVYTSLYELFSVTRDILSSMNPADISRRKGVADVILRTLNDGLRPHLTRWNASYRRWWELQLADDANNGYTPQELQRNFPRFGDLVEDLKRTNTELSRFADELLAIARADRRKPKQERPAPTPPGSASTGEQQEEISRTIEDAAVPPTAPYDGASAMPKNNPPHQGEL